MSLHIVEVGKLDWAGIAPRLHIGRIEQKAACPVVAAAAAVVVVWPIAVDATWAVAADEGAVVVAAAYIEHADAAAAAVDDVVAAAQPYCAETARTACIYAYCCGSITHSYCASRGLCSRSR